MTESADARLGTLVDRYRLLARLGEGGMGVVYRAEHVLIGRQVALKLLRPELVQMPQLEERFFREARAANEVASPHLVQVTDFGKSAAGDTFLVMELLGGRSLRALLDEERRLVPQRAVAIARQVCLGLAAAHRCGVVHRDLKPGNIQLVQQGSESELVKLLDFGIAKLTEQQDSNLTLPGTIMGSPVYMSPEQAVGRAVGPATDIYALGVVLYEMLCGAAPFAELEAPELVMAKLGQPPPPLRPPITPVGAALESLILACLATAPADRPASMERVGQKLEAWLAGTAAPGAAGSAPQALARGSAHTHANAPGGVAQQPTDKEQAPTLWLGGAEKPPVGGAVLDGAAPAGRAAGADHALGGQTTRRIRGRKGRLVRRLLVFLVAGVAAALLLPGRWPDPAERQSASVKVRRQPEGLKRALPPAREPQLVAVTPPPSAGPAAEADAGTAAAAASGDAAPEVDPAGEAAAAITQIPLELAQTLDAEEPEVVLLSDPEGASVYQGDQQLGQTPLKLTSPRAAQLTIRQAGYQPFTVALQPNLSGIINVELSPAPPREQIPRASATPAKQRRRTASARRQPPGHSLSALRRLLQRKRISGTSYRRLRRRLLRQRNSRIRHIRQLYRKGRLKRSSYLRYLRAIRRYYR